MKHTKSNKIISLLILMALFISGCGGNTKEVPALIDPVASNEAYRPVEYGDIGNVNLEYGVVVPMEHPHFWNVSVDVAEIKVDIGDYVNEGDVIAVANLDVVKETLNDLYEQLELQNETASINEKIFENRKAHLEYKILGFQEIGDTEGETAAKTELSILEENHRYDVLLNAHRVENLNSAISKQQELVNDGTLKARASGYVTYIKDLAVSNFVGSEENIIILSDYNDCYVELSEVYLNDKIFEAYTECYTYAGGKKYKLSEYSYTKNELLVSQSKSVYPNVRLKYEETSAMPEAGGIIPVFFYKELTEDVLIVGNDSLYKDETGDFVYVKNGENQEIRYIEIGEQDKNFTQVMSGLSEGELVFYSSEVVMPEVYEEYIVEASDYYANSTSDSYVFEETKKNRYFSDFEGRIQEIHVSEGDMVNAGDLICTVSTNEGSAVLAEMRNAIENHKENYTKWVSDADEQILAKQNYMDSIARESAEENGAVATPTDAVATGSDAQNEPVHPYEYEMAALDIDELKLQKDVMKINYEYQLANMEANYRKMSCNNDGSGNKYIYAEVSGKITNINLKKGKNIKASDKLFNIEVSANKKVLLTTVENLNLNQKLTFYDEKTGKEYTGYVSGKLGARGQKNYLTTVDGKVYVSYTAGSSERYYIQLDDETFFDTTNKCTAVYSVKTIYDTVVLPKGMIYTEFDIRTDKENYYVWRIVDGELVKQPVEYIGNTVKGEQVDCVINGIKPGDVLAQEKIITKDEAKE